MQTSPKFLRALSVLISLVGIEKASTQMAPAFPREVAKAAA